MILAAADYGEPLTGDPPPDLALAFSCRRWGCLPEAGGLLDQPAGLIRRMSIAENVYNVLRGMAESDNWAEYFQKNPQAEKLYKQVREMKNGC